MYSRGHACLHKVYAQAVGERAPSLATALAQSARKLMSLEISVESDSAAQIQASKDAGEDMTWHTVFLVLQAVGIVMLAIACVALCVIAWKLLVWVDMRGRAASVRIIDHAVMIRICQTASWDLICNLQNC